MIYDCPKTPLLLPDGERGFVFCVPAQGSLRNNLAGLTPFSKAYSYISYLLTNGCPTYHHKVGDQHG